MSFKSLVEFLSPPKNENKGRFFPCHLSCCDTFVYWWMQQCTHTIALIFLGHSSADDKIPNIQIQKKMFLVQWYNMSMSPISLARKKKIQTANRLATRRGATSADAVTWDAMSFAWFEQMWFFKHVCSQWLQQPLIHKTCTVSWKKIIYIFRVSRFFGQMASTHHQSDVSLDHTRNCLPPPNWEKYGWSWQRNLRTVVGRCVTYQMT